MLRATLLLAVSIPLFAAPTAAQADANCPCENARIQRHLWGALGVLGERDLSALTPTERRARSRTIDRLVTYVVRGQFPVNRDFPDQRMPYFRDADGTLCAMAYLIEEAGRPDIVDHVEHTRNNAWVRELAGEPALIAWLEKNGLTAAEAARIQPSYSIRGGECICGQAELIDTLVVARVIGIEQGLATFEVESVHGDPSSVYSAGAKVNINAWGSEEPGDRYLFRVHIAAPGDETIYDRLLIEQGKVQCHGDGMFTCVLPDDLRLATDKAIEAILSPDCWAAIEAEDGRFGEFCPDERSGCATAGRAALSGVLLPLLGWLLLCRRRV